MACVKIKGYKHVQDHLKPISPSTNSSSKHPSTYSKHHPDPYRSLNMLAPPRFGEMAAYASLRRDSVIRPTRERSSSSFLRHSLQKLGRFIDRRHVRDRGISHNPFGITIDASPSEFSQYSASQFDAQSVTTFDSSETLSKHASTKTLLSSPDKTTFPPVNAEKFPHLIGGTQAKLALPPSLEKAAMDISHIDIHFQNGQRISWRKRNGIVELPKAVRQSIWRRAIVHDRKLFICSCFYCQANSIVAIQPPLTRASRTIRAETLPMFYQDNQFQHPLSHPGNSSVRHWLTSIGVENRSLLRHLELTFLNVERAIESLDLHYHMQPAKDSIVVENVMWDDGQMGEMEWHVFTAQEKGPETEEVYDEDAQSVTTSILFDPEETPETSKQLESEAADSNDDWETVSSSGESTRALLAPTTPPQVHLTRKNGEAFGDPRWSFAGKFNDHVLRRLASLNRDAYQKVPRKPVNVTLMPNVVVASDRAIEDDESISSLGLDVVVEEPMTLQNVRHSGELCSVNWQRA